MKSNWLIGAAVCAALLSAGCTKTPVDAAKPKETADEFVTRVNDEMKAAGKELATAGFAYATFINVDTEFLNAKANERYLEAFGKAVEESKAYEGQQLSPSSARAIELLKLGVAAPAPKDPAKRAELSGITSKMEGMYGAAKYCPSGPESCKDQGELTDILATSRNYDALTDAWTGWHSTARPIRKEYVRFVELANEGARELGFADLGAMWRSGYDMPADDFTREATRLWQQVSPLYNQLHCYVRGKLRETYGEERVPENKPIPAQLLGNMWAQQWGEIYPLVEPYKGVSDLDVTSALVKQKYDPVKITQSAEAFYVSLGFPKLPQTFWERSLLKQPADRDVQCHASAWQMDGYEDVRIKQCIEPTQEHLMTVYHELGHVFYYLSYKDQPYLFQSGANDGFHEAIGDTVNLSMTPAYLHTIGLAGPVKRSREATINQQMKMALDKIAFLPFGKLIDEWRWKVFSGEVKPENYNAAWWQLREQYQGVAAPVPRSEEDFDPGAKYHIPANTPYTRYFLSFILQFQFHKALCDAAGFKGPLSECSVYGNEEAGRRFREMLALGQSQPWQDTLEKLTGTRDMDASAIMDYFAPLSAWLTVENEGQQCGWE
ncbi:MAG TPA: M2 family metallopeptidase [Povalibacter sp.]|uniref:M2 family metallopeptidase n=1 Tax=Povalibacter sp. TaxID=1962978 RepID=UPI002B50985E|nr:M2 family metallopeptidase [Povalibacter sp.]HMN44722.1 M2 family metallopeptidase [Povalibacter sp.]